MDLNNGQYYSHLDLSCWAVAEEKSVFFSIEAEKCALFTEYFPVEVFMPAVAKQITELSPPAQPQWSGYIFNKTLCHDSWNVGYLGFDLFLSGSSHRLGHSNGNLERLGRIHLALLTSGLMVVDRRERSRLKALDKTFKKDT